MVNPVFLCWYYRMMKKLADESERLFMASNAWMLTFCVISLPPFVIVQLKQNIYLDHHHHSEHHNDCFSALTLVEADNPDESQRRKKPMLRNRF